MRWTQEAFRQLAFYYLKQPGTAFLDSGSEYDSAQTSYLCLFPDESFTVKADEPHPWEVLKEKIGPCARGHSFPNWVGYISYEMGGFVDPDCLRPSREKKEPLACFVKPTVVIAFDHITSRIKVKKGSFSLSAPPRVSLQPVALERTSPIESEGSYLEKIAFLQEKIRLGEIYQACLSHEVQFRKGVSLPDLFFVQTALNPSPFAAYLAFDPVQVVSISPERFLSCTNGRLQTRPIKGTTPRGRDPQEDFASKRALLRSEKEQSELLMITDLMRNDLGRVSRWGSVEVVDLFQVEQYQNVFHLFSVIESNALPTLHPIDLLKGCFPPGSISGCPKLRAQSLLDQVEQRARGVYTGSIGYVAENGDFDFSVAIRTLFTRQGGLSLQLGGAITADSNPKKEYAETLVKGKFFMER